MLLAAVSTRPDRAASCKEQINAGGKDTHKLYLYLLLIHNALLIRLSSAREPLLKPAGYLPL